MNRSLSRNTEILQRRLQLRQQEGIAKQIPYISFILTHVALVLFLLVAFFIDQLVKDQATNIATKIGMSVFAVIFLASEWIYAMSISRRWKRMIVTLLELEEEQRVFEEQEQRRQHENELSLEQLKNRALQIDLQRRRDARALSQPSIQPQSPSPSSTHHAASNPLRPVRLQQQQPSQQQQPPYNRPFDPHRNPQ